MLIDINLTGETYKSRSLPLSAQVTRNFYPEIQDNESARSQFVLMPFPGYDFFGSDVGVDATATIVVFDGTNDYLCRGADLTGNADAKVGTFAARIKHNGGDGGNQRYLVGSTSAPENRFLIYRDTNNKITLFAKNASGTTIFLNATTSTWTVSDGWLNLLISWDLANDTKAQIYVNDTDNAAAASTFTNDTIDYTLDNWCVGADASGLNKLNADVDFAWFDLTRKIDFSVEANRRKFFNSDGDVVDLGSDGSIPTGTSPILYLNGDSDEFAANKGTGGGLTETGDLADGDLGSGTNRGTFEHQGVLYSVDGTNLYSVASTGVHTLLGSGGEILGTDPCIFDGIGDNVVIATEGKAFVYNGSTVTEVTDSDLETPDSVAHLNNQILYDGDDGRFASSDVGDATSIDGLNYATAESNADDLVRVYVLNQTLYLMGDRTIEQWWNSGDGSPPFDRIEGGIIPIGLKALHSVADNGDVMYFLGDDLRIWAVSGSSKKFISTIALSNAIEGYTTTTDAVGTYFTIQGQGFYQITFPQEDKSWCFHEQSQQWFEVSSGSSGGRAIFNYAANAYGKTIVADKSNGNLYTLDVETFDENGSAIHRIRDSAPLHGGLLKAPGKWIECNRFELIMETGVGDLTDTPQVMLSWSDDGGRTFSTEVWGTTNVGTAGNYQKRIEWFGLGGFYERIFRIRMTESVRWSIYSAAADVDIGI